MAGSNLDRLYSLLEAKTGIKRVRSTLLERVAMDRALEMRYQQGLTFDSNNPLQHEMDQLKARVYPFQQTNHVTENIAWHYYPPDWVDPIEGVIEHTFPADAQYGDLAGKSVGWWNSTIHRQQLEDTRYTHWGNGIHFEDPPGTHRRWYFVTVLAQPLEGPPVANRVLPAGKNIGFHLTASGKVIHRQTRTLKEATWVTYDDYHHIPGGGLMYHLATGPLRRRWVSIDG